MIDAGFFEIKGESIT